jgi:hypothetical protein
MSGHVVALGGLVVAEVLRRFSGPSSAVVASRCLSDWFATRLTYDRGRLVAALASVDRRLPGRGNCYRRVLAETLLSAEAARDQICLGMNSRDRKRIGHAWFLSRPDAESSGHETVFTL